MRTMVQAELRRGRSNFVPDCYLIGDVDYACVPVVRLELEAFRLLDLGRGVGTPD